MEIRREMEKEKRRRIERENEDDSDDFFVPPMTAGVVHISEQTGIDYSGSAEFTLIRSKQQDREQTGEEGGNRRKL